LKRRAKGKETAGTNFDNYEAASYGWGARGVIVMNTQKQQRNFITDTQKIKKASKLRRLIISVFVVCLLASAALLSVGLYGVGRDGKSASVALPGSAFSFAANGAVPYAQAAAADYYITYHNVNPGENTFNPTTYNVGTPNIELRELADRIGYAFEGWYTDDKYTNKIIGVAISTGSEGNKEFWARWEAVIYTVILEYDNGPGASTTVYATYGSAMPAVTEAPPQRRGYDFGGYYTQSDGGGTQYYTANMASARPWDIPVNETHLRAKWTPVNYSITYNNIREYGATKASNPDWYTIESGKIELKAASRKGFDFAGWFSDEYFENEVQVIEADSTEPKAYWARWQIITYTVAYLNLGGVSNPNAGVVVYTVESGYISLEPLGIRPGYIFAGWYERADLTGSATVSIPTGSVGNKIFYANWADISYQLTFDSRGGSRIWARDVAYGEAVGALLKPTRKGYEFAGWWTTVNGGTEYTQHTIYGITRNTQLYARWTALGGGADASGSLIEGVGDTVIILVLVFLDVLLLLVLLIIAVKDKRRIQNL
jgi:uncharacterized repeat protein (TIGR02543 family)